MVVYLMEEKSMVVLSPVTGLPGMNLRDAGFGVGLVLMKSSRFMSDCVYRFVTVLCYRSLNIIPCELNIF